MTGTGRATRTKSLKMLNAALAYQNAVKLIQEPPPGRDLSKAYCTGEHWNMLDITVLGVNAVMITIHVQQVMTNQRCIKRRRYSSNMLSLVRPMLILYNI